MTKRAAVTAFVALGGNLGDARAAVRRAIQDLGRLPGTRLEAASGLYRSAPHEAQGPDFINAVARIATTLTAPELLRAAASAGSTPPAASAPT